MVGGKRKLLLFCFILMAIQQTQANQINHEHGERQHSHALPAIGIVHQHGNGALGTVSESKASLMYKAVYLSGPRWGAGSEKRLTEKEFKLLLSESIFDVLVSSKLL